MQFKCYFVHKVASLYKTPKSEKGHNSANNLQSKSGHLHLKHNLFGKYHDPSSRGSPDFTSSFMG